MADALKVIAPIAGTILGGPVGGILGGALGGAASNAFGSGKGIGGILGPAAMGGLGGLAGGLQLPGGQGTVASALGKAFMTPQGGIDFSKVAGGIGSIADLMGTEQQRQSAQNFMNARIAQQNMLMNRIMGPQNYGLSPKLSPGPNLNQQSSATPAVGSGTTGGNY